MLQWLRLLTRMETVMPRRKSLHDC